jgi:hypothetical protein
MDVAGRTSDATTMPGDPPDGVTRRRLPWPALAGIHFGPGWDEDQDGGGVQDGAEEAGPVEPEEPPR